MSISYADMREIVAIQHKHKQDISSAEFHNEFIDCMTKVRMEQHRKIEDKVEALLNQLVFPDVMIVEMSKILSPKKKKIKFNIIKKIGWDKVDYSCGCGDSVSCEKCYIEEDVECNSCEGICDSYDYNECEECSKIICDNCRHSCYSICYDCKPKGMLEEEVECECCEE